ncbi:glycoside hydrolase family 95 protein [Paenibacillus antri]|uniref:Glycoside hydrolase family 95 protein n=1 Tax=Paenibacillus antri TaxID=2582848 RepID=A0A5R9GCJ1_9BACL|nr:glycoside hydrolase family 95 protein [Paenibacillus antri]TLS51800.1 glycoside hydrolase family 95 protein [Paenibacillus antri]
MLSANDDRKLWYRKPASEWNEALPLGNGKLGAMVFGKVRSEIISLNEDSLWYGGPRDRHNPDAAAYLPRIRELVFAGRPKEAERLAALALTGLPETQRHYVPLGDVLLTFPNAKEEDAVEYVRDLNLSEAIARVRYRIGDVEYTRELLASHPDNVLAIRLAASVPGALDVTARLGRAKWRYAERIDRIGVNMLSMRGNGGGEGGVDFRAVLRCETVGGTVQSIGEHLVVEGAEEVVFYLAAATTFRHADPEAYCLERVDAAASKGYSAVREDHIADYARLFGRVRFSLGGDAEPAHLDTAERLERVKSGERDHGLTALYFHYGRYLLISSSRPGSLPANLQGIWNKDFLPSWDSKFTININLQMNYWLAESCNLSELHEPLFELIERLNLSGKRTAAVMYGCRGSAAHHNTDIWADSAPQDTWIPATYWPLGLVWLSLHLWERYRYTGDLEFLAKHYDILKESSLFALDFLVESPEGELVTCPSVSPENTYLLDNGDPAVFTYGATMDNQLLRALFGACIEASSLLHVDEAFRGELSEAASRLPRTRVGKHGQIQEWIHDYDEEEPGHRHISHLFGLHPGNEISVGGTPELAEAARVTLERRLANGGGHTGWSRAWIINFWARLENGKQAGEHLQALLAKSTLPNLLDHHPPFQIDGNFGGTAGIAEMLLQSQNDELHLLPALPPEWTEGEAYGLRARGGFTVSLTWVRGELEEARINAGLSRICRVRIGNSKPLEFAVTAGRTYALREGKFIETNPY